jgi:hypothetical protein
MAKEKGKAKAEEIEDISDKFGKAGIKQLKAIVRKYLKGGMHEKKVEKVYRQVVCLPCPIRECVNHPHTVAPHGYDDGIPDKILDKVEKMKASHYCCIFDAISPEMIDSYIEGDMIADMLADKFDEEFDEKGLVDITVQHLGHLKKDMAELSKYKDSNEIVALRHLIRAVSFLLRHSNTHPSTI